MIFRVKRNVYVGGDEYTIHMHESGLEFYRGPSIPDVISSAMGERDTVYFEWKYDEEKNSIDLDGWEVSNPAGG
jgi:hypothetical protein